MVETKKLTKKEAYGIAIDLLGNCEHEHKEEVVRILQNEIELLNKKATAKSKKDLEKAEVDNKLANTLYNILMEEGLAKTATELLNTRIKEEAEGINVQKVTHLLSTLLVDKRVTKESIKGRTYYTAI